MNTLFFDESVRNINVVSEWVFVEKLPALKVDSSLPIHFLLILDSFEHILSMLVNVVNRGQVTE